MTRGSDGTAAASHSAGATVKHVASAQDFREPQDHMATSAGVHGITGSVVGTNDSQNLTNKDLSGAGNVFPSYLAPPGSILPFAGSAAPTGYLICDGSTVSRTTYAALFAVCGTTYNTGGEAGTDFRLPNLKGRIPVGIDSAQVEFDTRGEQGGEKAHALTTAELASHNHTINHSHTASSGTESADHSHSGSTGGQSASHSHSLGISDAGGLGGGGSLVRKGGIAGDSSGGASNDHSHAFTTGGRSAAHTHGITVDAFSGSGGNTGSGTAHNNLQPYVALHYIIKT